MDVLRKEIARFLDLFKIMPKLKKKPNSMGTLPLIRRLAYTTQSPVKLSHLGNSTVFETSNTDCLILVGTISTWISYSFISKNSEYIYCDVEVEDNCIDIHWFIDENICVLPSP